MNALDDLRAANLGDPRDAILQPHLDATVERAKAEPWVVVAHDATEFSFSSDRDGLGPINDSGHGFSAHLASVISADGQRRPLGAAGPICTRGPALHS